MQEDGYNMKNCTTNQFEASIQLIDMVFLKNGWKSPSIVSQYVFEINFDSVFPSSCSLMAFNLATIQ